MKDNIECFMDNNNVYINEITDYLYLLNNETSIVNRIDLYNSTKNELKAIIKIILYMNDEGFFDYSILLKSIIPNDSYLFLNNIKCEFNSSNNFDILDGFDLLKCYEKLQNQCDKKIFGQYYTPQIILDRMLNGIDIKNYYSSKLKILDPACGVGAFLLRLIDKSIDELKDYRKVKFFLNNCIFGNDINTNSVLMTRLCLIIHLKKYFPNKNILNDFGKLINNIRNVNTLFYNETQQFDLIIGNPPYFKTKISNDIKEKYKEIINGQPNVYGLFLYWAVIQTIENGQVIFVIPQSMMSGKYFKKLRNFLSNYNIISIEIINSKKRNKIFLHVEQAVMIINLKKENNNAPTLVRFTSFDKNDTQIVIENQQLVFSDNFIAFPRNDPESKLLNKLTNCSKLCKPIQPYKFGNGLFVWNQQKEFLVDNINKDAIPIIYANYIKEGEFKFIPNNNNIEGIKNRKPYCKLSFKNTNFQYNTPTLIIKRTSSLNKFQRINSCLISEDFVKCYKSYFVENHVNLLYNSENKCDMINPKIAQYLHYYLKSNVANYYIKKTNGNTQVSANELNNLPFFSDKIPINDLTAIEWNIGDNLQKYFYKKFKLTKEDISIIEGEKDGK